MGKHRQEAAFVADAEDGVAERLVSLFFSQAELLIWCLSADRNIARASESHAELLEIDPTRCIGPVSAMVHPADEALFEAAIASSVANGSAHCDMRVRHGTRGWVPTAARILRVAKDESSSEAGLLVLLRANRVGQEDLFRTLAEHVPGTVYLCRNDDTYSMMFLSDRVQELTGRSQLDFVSGRISFVDLYHPDDCLSIQGEVDRALADRRPFDLRYRLRHADGSYRHVREYGQGIWGAAGELLMLEGTLFDETLSVKREQELRSMEAKLSEATRLESLGLLAGGIAHDFNNVMAVILGSVDLARQQTTDPVVASALDGALEAAARARTLTKKLLAYAGRKTAPATRIDVASAVADTVALVQSGRRSFASYVFAEADESLAVSGDLVQLQQVLMNLLINAGEAVNNADKRVVISVRNEWRKAGSLLSGAVTFGGEPPPKAGAYVVISIADEGIGMDEQTQARIFEPFFTTKEAGHGLGLASVLEIVAAHSGVVTVESEVDKGSTFSVFLPQLVEEESTFEGDRERILVVDSDAQTTAMIATSLQRAGLTYVVASTVEEAVADAAKKPIPELVIASIQGGCGQHAFAAVEALRRQGVVCPMILYCDCLPTTLPEPLGQEPLRFIKRPFSSAELVALVGEIAASANEACA